MKEKSVKFNYFMNLFLTASTIIFPLVTFPYVSRTLTPTGTGLVTFANSIVTYFSMFTQLGIPTYGIRETAKYRNNKEKLSKFVQEVISINFITCAISYVAYGALIYFNDEMRANLPLYLIMGINIALNSFGMEWLYKGLEQYRYITVRSVIFKLIALVFTFILVNKQEDVYIYGMLYILASAGSNLFNLIHARKYVKFTTFRKISIKPHLKAIFIFFFMSVATNIYTNLDNVMLGFMKGSYEVGIYSAATKVKTVLVCIVTSLGTVLLPRESYYVSTGQYNLFYSYLKKAIHFTFIIAFPLMIYFFVFSTDVILVLAGKAYMSASLSVKILIPTILFIGFSNILGMQMLVPLGREKQVLISVCFGAIVDFIINLSLIPCFGAQGAAFGTMVAEVVVLVVQYDLNRKEIKVNQILELENKLMIFTGTIIAVTLSYVFVSRLVNPLIRLIFSWIIYIIIYGLWLIFIKDKLAMQVIKALFEKIRLLDKN